MIEKWHLVLKSLINFPFSIYVLQSIYPIGTFSNKAQLLIFI